MKNISEMVSRHGARKIAEAMIAVMVVEKGIGQNKLRSFDFSEVAELPASLQLELLTFQISLGSLPEEEWHRASEQLAERWID